jgi:dipeptidyl aminopeptidase/acylaminoacyl peptidase
MNAPGIYRVRTVPSPFHPYSVLYVPDGVASAPGVILLHGSEGAWAGWSDCLAAQIAAFGFACAPFPYGKGGSPWTAGNIVDIDLENTVTALTKLRAHPLVQGRKVALFGNSRGAEHALLVTSLMARDDAGGLPDAVLAQAPASSVFGGFEGATPDIDVGKPAWRWQGTSEYLQPEMPIAIERFAGPLFLSHGLQDQLWSAEFTRELEQRLRAAGRDPEVYFYAGDHMPGPDAHNIWLDKVVAFLNRTIN